MIHETKKFKAKEPCTPDDPVLLQVSVDAEGKPVFLKDTAGNDAIMTRAEAQRRKFTSDYRPPVAASKSKEKN